MSLPPGVVLRVQHLDGRGPFRPGITTLWIDQGRPTYQPTWMEEFGHDLITARGIPGAYHGTGVRTLDQLCRWFSSSERAKLRGLGFAVARMNADRVLAESPHQLVFARFKPFNDAEVEVLPWPK